MPSASTLTATSCTSSRPWPRAHIEIHPCTAGPHWGPHLCGFLRLFPVVPGCLVADGKWRLSSSAGTDSQAERRGFESRFPLRRTRRNCRVLHLRNVVPQTPHLGGAHIGAHIGRQCRLPLPIRCRDSASAGQTPTRNRQWTCPGPSWPRCSGLP